MNFPETKNVPPSSGIVSPGNHLPPQGRNPWKTFGITIIVLLTILLAGWLIKSYLFPSEFSPVSLSSNETRTLNQKLEILHLPTMSGPASSGGGAVKPLKPEAYSEQGADREVVFSEREVNALIAHNTDMADKFAIDLSNNLASARLLMPLDPEMPVFGGKTLSLTAGIEFNFVDGKPVVRFKGVSAWGVPVPNAWMGNLKNVDLVSEFGRGEGFWKSFSEGIEYIKVSDGKIVVKLKE